GLPRDHAPAVSALRIDGQVADGETLLLAVALHVHLGDAGDDANTVVHAHGALARRDAAIVRLAGTQVRDVLGFRLEPRGGVHVRQVVGERGVERRPVLAAHGIEATVVGTEHFGFDRGRGGSCWTHGSTSSRTGRDPTTRPRVWLAKRRRFHE